MSDLASRPTRDQREAFARLSVEARFHWLTDLLALCFELTPEELRARWRSNVHASGVPAEDHRRPSE